MAMGYHTAGCAQCRMAGGNVGVGGRGAGGSRLRKIAVKKLTETMHMEAAQLFTSSVVMMVFVASSSAPQVCRRVDLNSLQRQHPM
jgi:hypothetical protein